MRTVYILDVIGAIGDSLCSEPVVRYAIRCLEGQDVRIQTNHPHLFKHLNKPMGISPEELGIDLNDPELKIVHIFNRHELLIDGRPQVHPFVDYVSPHLTPAIDFISLFMLKRVLPDEDKRIHIEFKDTTQKLEKMVGGKLERLVLLHAGTGAPENTRLFPEDYCRRLVGALDLVGLKVAVIATTDDRSHCTNFMNEKDSFTNRAIDLINKLDWDDFCTIISKAKVLITNDSSPVHIASMFDNWLIVLPTVKHPDRLIHPRQGHRYHKAIALYKKLMIDDVASIPVGMSLVHCNWGDIASYREDFLPHPATIAAHAVRAASGKRDLIGGINPEISHYDD